MKEIAFLSVQQRLHKINFAVNTFFKFFIINQSLLIHLSSWESHYRHLVFTPPLFANLCLCSACKLLYCKCSCYLSCMPFMMSLCLGVFKVNLSHRQQFSKSDAIYWYFKKNELFAKHLLPPSIGHTYMYIIGCTSLYYNV